ncbi:hydroxypyruvate isomerase family protein [Actinokineospora xionganensis]|uniref:TIM barrel protein n=1 Tax=Actinokineospora xionganensis TaxID=2684470 RepID=A0ABR7L107_9PSEU|nr:TIM barrel protein [Actinokineospora xionganensis]MBC6446119.1 TIM barrel protein [Actinokineospora xionganensis]
MGHSLRFEVNCSILFTDLPLLERPRAAKDAGFDAVEFWWPFPEAVPAQAEVDAFVSALQDADVRLVGLNFFAGDMPGGDRGLVSWVGREQEFRDNVALVTEIGVRTGCRAFNALYGNRIDGVDPGAQDDLGAANLAHAAESVARIGGTVLVEAVSGPQPYPLRTAADAFAVIDRVGAPNVRFLADLFHLAMNSTVNGRIDGNGLDKVIDEYADRTAHVQIADAPGRHEPGSGDLAVDAALARLERVGYRGWVGLEYVPSTTTVESFAWLPRERRSGK